MESKSDFRQYYEPRASLLYLCPSPAIMWSAAAVLSGVCSHWPGRKHYHLQSQLLDAFMPLWNDSRCTHNTHSYLPKRWFLRNLYWNRISLVDAVTGGKASVKFQDCFSLVVVPLTVWTHPHFSWEFTPPLQCDYSLKGLDEEFNVGASGNLHTIAHRSCE